MCIIITKRGAIEFIQEWHVDYLFIYFSLHPYQHVRHI